MKQEEKNRKSREHILTYAFAEFAAHGYVGASINTICSTGKISKGLLYHYYADRDTLYLACVERCFCDLTSYLTNHLDINTVTPDEYFNARTAFFRENPLHHNLFCDTVTNPQGHLKKQISDCRASFDALNEAALTAILKKETLAEGVSIQDAVWQLRLLEDFISTYLKNADQQARQPEELNRLCRQTLHVMLYGMIAHK